MCIIWAALRKKVPYALSHCYSKRGALLLVLHRLFRFFGGIFFFLGGGGVGKSYQKNGRSHGRPSFFWYGGCAHPSFGMTLTQGFRDHFAGHDPYIFLINALGAKT